MKLITEHIEDIKVLIEAKADSSERQYHIVGPFLQAEIKNRNGRSYPLSILQNEVARYQKEFIDENRALGELCHPDSPTINLDRVSHRILSLTQEGNDFIGKARILDTPMGKIAKTFIDDGIKLGVSSRGVGSLVEGPDGDTVGDDFYLATPADIVYDPSAPAAFVRGIVEHKEWVWQNGQLVESLATSIKKAPVKSPQEAALLETRTFERFLREFRVKVK